MMMETVKQLKSQTSDELKLNFIVFVSPRVFAYVCVPCLFVRSFHFMILYLQNVVLDLANEGIRDAQFKL